jgi:hypothetical protein
MLFLHSEGKRKKLAYSLRVLGEMQVWMVRSGCVSPSLEPRETDDQPSATTRPEGATEDHRDHLFCVPESSRFFLSQKLGPTPSGRPPAFRAKK